MITFVCLSSFLCAAITKRVLLLRVFKICIMEINEMRETPIVKGSPSKPQTFCFAFLLDYLFAIVTKTTFRIDPLYL